MALPFPHPRYLPCSDCGAAIEQSRSEEHVCERERLLDFQMFQLRDAVDAVEGEVAAYLDSPRGRFVLWCAERNRRDDSGPRA
jgi:hypothetical protein